MKKISIIALALAVLISFGCAKDYLETSPSGSIKRSQVFESIEGAEAALNGLNKIMKRQYGAYGQGYNGEGTVRLYYGEYLGNNLMKGNSTGFQNSANGNLYVSNSATLASYAWYYYYTLVHNANMILDHIGEIEGNVENSRNYIKAQALCYRAYAYSNLVQIYGRRWSDGSDKPACLLRLTADDQPDNLDRSTAAQVYAQIYADLDEAISLFNQSGMANSRSNAYTMDLDVAYAIYARAALTREDWSKALQYAQLVRKGYPLMSVADELDGFSKPTSEWIWYLYGTDSETLYYYDYFCYAAFNAQTSTTRNYPLLISKHLFDQIPSTDIRRAFWLDPAGYSGTYNTNTNKARSQNSSNKLWAYGQDYAKNVRGHELLSTHCIFAYMNFKICNVSQPGIGNECLFRASEMLLIEAEAQYRLGHEAEAQALLVELNTTSGRDPAYTCTATGADLMEQIKLYRGIELWGEGFNWFDLKRWGDSIDRKAYKNGGNWMSSYAVTFGPNEKNNWTWCIPRNETDYNKGISSTAN